MTSDSNPSRVERVLAFMVAGVVGVSVLCFFAVLIGTWMGQAAAQTSGTGFWTVVIMFPYFGLPAGMLLLISLFIVSAVRRSREARESE